MNWIVCAVALALLLPARSPTAARAAGQNELFIFNELCALKDEPGPCKAIMERFFFDVDTGRCTQFLYGGCGGNANNFLSLEECEQMCVVSDDKDPCHLAEAPGPCRGLVTRYFFDSTTQQCRRFFYGGCFGNANNFRSLADCQARCPPPAKPATEVHTQRSPTATASMSTGELTLGEHRLQLNQTKVMSEVFLPAEECFLPADVGDQECKQEEKRFAFNASTKRCSTFSYSGCGGNRNNFLLRKHCIHKCIKNKKGHGRRMMIRIRKKNLDSIAVRSV